MGMSHRALLVLMAVTLGAEMSFGVNRLTTVAADRSASLCDFEPQLEHLAKLLTATPDANDSGFFRVGVRRLDFACDKYEKVFFFIVA